MLCFGTLELDDDNDLYAAEAGVEGVWRNVKRSNLCW